LIFPSKKEKEREKEEKKERKESNESIEVGKELNLIVFSFY